MTMGLQWLSELTNNPLFQVIHYWLFEAGIFLARKGILLLQTNIRGLRDGQNLLQLESFGLFLQSPKKKEIETIFTSQKKNIEQMLNNLSLNMKSRQSRVSQWANLQTPIDFKSLNSNIQNCRNKILNAQMGYQVNSNPSNKRRFMFVCAIMSKSLYVDMEFPYFVEFKKKKFHWKEFMQNFNTASIEEYERLARI